MTALLFVRFLQLKSKLNWHLSRFIALLRPQLFVYRDLGLFLDHPFEGPPGANLAEESPPPLLAGLFEAAPDPQPEPKSRPTGTPEAMTTGVPAVEGCQFGQQWRALDSRVRKSMSPIRKTEAFD